MDWLDSFEVWGGVVVAVRIIASAFIAYFVGYLVGQSSGYNDGIKACSPKKKSNYTLGVDVADKKAKIYLVK